ncbi:MAG: hypothetical protein V3R87_02060 [Dehalococcoidia bacterium]
MELELYENCIGNCIVCGSDATGSPYWLGMTEAQWAVIRPLVTHMYKPDHVQDILFIPQLCKPLCGPECSAKHNKEIDDAG